MISLRDVDASDVLVVIGLVLLACAVYLGLGGVAAVAFLGAVLLVMGGYLAYARRNVGGKN